MATNFAAEPISAAATVLSSLAVIAIADTWTELRVGMKAKEGQDLVPFPYFYTSCRSCKSFVVFASTPHTWSHKHSNLI
jgi:hypothetical protein